MDAVKASQPKNKSSPELLWMDCLGDLFPSLEVSHNKTNSDWTEKIIWVKNIFKSVTFECCRDRLLTKLINWITFSKLLFVFAIPALLQKLYLHQHCSAHLSQVAGVGWVSGAGAGWTKLACLLNNLSLLSLDSFFIFFLLALVSYINFNIKKSICLYKKYQLKSFAGKIAFILWNIL